MMPAFYIIDGIRTPFCKVGTDLAQESAVDLGAGAFRQVLARTGIDPALIDAVIVGCVGQPADAANLARVMALRAGIPEKIPAFTVHRNCASGVEAFTQAYQAATANRGKIFLIGATESMSNYPLLFPGRATKKFSALSRARNLWEKCGSLSRFRPSDFRPRITLKLGLTDPTCNLNMGQTAENLAREFRISRGQQDAFALRSHRRAIAARGCLREETFALYPGSSGRRPHLVENDNGPRPQQSEEALGKLRPVFERPYGTVTAGNASQITDGAVAMLAMTGPACRQLGVAPMGRIIDYAYAGCDPRRMGLGPAYAINEVERRTGLGIRDADLIEINEAFAAQVLAVKRACQSTRFCQNELHRPSPLGRIPREKLNVNGGAIALGHPVGATGGRLILSSLRELKRRNAQRALVTLCVGGGQGAALWLEAA